MKQKRKISVLIALAMMLTVFAVPSVTYGATNDGVTYGIAPANANKMPDYLAVGGTLDLNVKSNPASSVNQGEWKWQISYADDDFDDTKESAAIATIDPNTGVLTARSEGSVSVRAYKLDPTVTDDEVVAASVRTSLRIGYLRDTSVSTNDTYYNIRLYPNKTAKLGRVSFDFYSNSQSGQSAVASTTLVIPSQYVIDNPAWSSSNSEFNEKYYGTYKITSIMPEAANSKVVKSIIVPDTITSIGNYALGYNIVSKWNSNTGKYDKTYNKVAGVTIYGTSNNTAAAKYAKANGFTYKNMNVKPVTVTNSKPKKVTGVKAKAGKKQMTVTWKKVKGAAGYQVTYAQDKKFKKAKKNAAVNKGATTKKVVKKLKSGKKYYVKVRAYKKSGNKKVYGAYSKAQSVKIK